MFDEKLLKRDSMKKHLKKVGERIDCVQPIKVMFPTRYLDIGFAKIDMEVECLGVNMVFDKNFNYDVSTLPNMVKYAPSQIDEIEVNGKSFTIMEFTPPNFIVSDKVIDIADPVYEELVELFMKGNVPFFLERDDILKMFTKSTRTTSKKVGLDPTRISALMAVTARDQTGKNEVRLMPNYNKPIKWVSMINADLAYNNNMSRFMGSYQDRGLTAALNDDNPIKTEIEQVYRS